MARRRNKREKKKVNEARRANGNKKRGNGKGRNPDKRHDQDQVIKMIRDFFVHLMWELRLAAFSLTSVRGTGHAELQEQVDGFRKAYGVRRLVTLPDEQESDASRIVQRNRYSEALRHLEALDTLFESGLQRFQSSRQARNSGYDTDLIVEFINSLERVLVVQNADCLTPNERPEKADKQRSSDADNDLAASNSTQDQSVHAVNHLRALLPVLTDALDLVNAASALNRPTECHATDCVEPTKTARARKAIALFLTELARTREWQGESEDTTSAFVKIVLAYIDACAGMTLRNCPFVLCKEDIEECGRVVIGKGCDGSESLTRDQVYHALHWFLASHVEANPSCAPQDRLRKLIIAVLEVAKSGGMFQKGAKNALELIENGIENGFAEGVLKVNEDAIENGFGGVVMRHGFTKDDSIEAAYDMLIAFARDLFGAEGYVATGEEYLRDSPFA